MSADRLENSKREPRRRLVLARAVQADVAVPEIGQAVAEHR
jgi:hypothetical protein